MNGYRLPKTKSLEEDVMMNIKGLTNLIGPLMISSFVLYLGAIFIKNDGVTRLSDLVNKIFSIFTFG